MKVIVTGAAGFIGFHLCKQLIANNCTVLGFDNINDYYDTNLKYGRLNELGINKRQANSEQIEKSTSYSNFEFVKLDLEDADGVNTLFNDFKPDYVVNLAAQAGVRYSIENPRAYVNSNITGFFNVLEACKNNPPKHLVYASSSSIYGDTKQVPFKTEAKNDAPVSLYAATKKSNELMAHVYSHLHQIPTTGLRFFTVYGPWGRPDMAYFKFSDLIVNGKAIQVYNNGELERDFTYIDDIIEGISNVTFANVNKRTDLFKVYNIGNNKPIKLLKFIETLESELGITAIKEFVPHQAGDVHITWADVKDLIRDFNYKPSTQLNKGIQQFVNWYRIFYNL